MRTWWRQTVHSAAGILAGALLCLSACSTDSYTPGDPNSAEYQQLQFLACFLGAEPCRLACRLTHLDAIQPRNWAFVRQELVYQRSLGTSGTVIAENFGNASAAAWLGGAVGLNGKVYGIPVNTPYAILEQTTTPSSSEFGSVTNTLNGWAGGVLAPNGKIYGLPAGTPSVIVVDPDTKTVSEFAVSSTVNPNDYAGGVLAPNGKIYVVPNGAGNVLEIDPSTNTTSTFGSIGGSCQGAVLAPTGKIICIPGTATAIFEIDPVNRSVSSFGSAPGGNQYLGGALAPNGKIYAMPLATATAVLEIDPVNRTTTQFGTVTPGYASAVLAPNGLIYGIGAIGVSSLLEVDPVAQTATTVASWPANNFLSANLAGDSLIYGMPNSGTVLTRVNTGSVGTFCPTLIQAAYFNKY